MDERRFDEETCGLAERGSGRRGVLKAVVAGGFVAALGRVAGRPAAAKAKEAKGPCTGKCGAACDKRTALIRCSPGNEDCACVRSTSGKVSCADTSPDCPATGAPDECKKDADCGPDAVCVPTAGSLCCTGLGQAQVNLCLTLCPNGFANAKSGKGTGSLLGLRDRLPLR
jgi:hypothetical protein